MTPAEFARAVDRIRYSPWCPTCGCTRVRWAGCSNAWHAIQGNGLATHPCERMGSDNIDDPGAVGAARGLTRKVTPRMNDCTALVNPEPAPDGA